MSRERPLAMLFCHSLRPFPTIGAHRFTTTPNIIVDSSSLDEASIDFLIKYCPWLFLRSKKLYAKLMDSSNLSRRATNLYTDVTFVTDSCHLFGIGIPRNNRNDNDSGNENTTSIVFTGVSRRTFESCLAAIKAEAMPFYHL